MQNIQVAVLDEHNDPSAMMMLLAKLTQRGHNIKDMADVLSLYESSANTDSKVVQRIAALPHGTIKRFCPITIAIVGASRRFLAQARTHQIGFNYVSASLQYSDYSNRASFVVPYALTEADANENMSNGYTMDYLESCYEALGAYERLAEATDNDTAGYVAPQGLRNVLIMQGNHEAWHNFIRARSCHRNTNETQYVTLLIWEALLKTNGGEDLFKFAGPDCMFGACREGKFACGSPLKKLEREASSMGIAAPRHILNTFWPLLNKEE